MPENSSKIRFFKNFHPISQKIHDTVVGVKTNWDNAEAIFGEH